MNNCGLSLAAVALAAATLSAPAPAQAHDGFGPAFIGGLAAGALLTAASGGYGYYGPGYGYYAPYAPAYYEPTYVPRHVYRRAYRVQAPRYVVYGPSYYGAWRAPCCY
jgi:hypothetical protein